MILVVSIGQPVYKLRVKKQRGVFDSEVSYLEGKITKIGNKYAYAETTWSGKTVTWKIPFATLLSQDRHSEYFLDLEKFKKEQEEAEAEREINRFSHRNMGHDIRRLTYEDKMAIRDILRKYKEEIRL